MKIEMRVLEQLLPSDHAARVVWEFVRKLDLAEFYAGIKAVEGRPGQPPVDPAILLALWLLATIEGGVVPSAGEVARASASRAGSSGGVEESTRRRCGSGGSKSAKERVANERIARVEEALAQLPELEAKMERRQKGDGAKARCSTTDADSRRMKMADGGRQSPTQSPAYNVQLATTDETRLIVGWDVTNDGADGGLMTPMVEQIATHFGQRPHEHLADGGFSSKRDIDELESHGTTVFTPVKEEEQKRAKGQDPFAPRPGDSPTIAAWRERMGTAAAQAVYKLRPSLAEFPNAVFRNRGLRQFLVRGLKKVKAATLWQVLAFNLTRLQTLGWLHQL